MVGLILLVVVIVGWLAFKSWATPIIDKQLFDAYHERKNSPDYIVPDRRILHYKVKLK